MLGLQHVYNNHAHVPENETIRPVIHAGLQSVGKGFHTFAHVTLIILLFTVLVWLNGGTPISRNI